MFDVFTAFWIHFAKSPSLPQSLKCVTIQINAIQSQKVIVEPLYDIQNLPAVCSFAPPDAPSLEC